MLTRIEAVRASLEYAEWTGLGWGAGQARPGQARPFRALRSYSRPSYVDPQKTCYNELVETLENDAACFLPLAVAAFPAFNFHAGEKPRWPTDRPKTKSQSRPAATSLELGKERTWSCWPIDRPPADAETRTQGWGSPNQPCRPV